MTTPTTTPTDALDAPAGKPAAAWEDLVDVFTSPAAVFRRRLDGRWLLPLLVYTLLSVVAFYVARPAMRPALERQMAPQIAKIQADPNTSAEQKAQAAGFIRATLDSPFTAAIAVVTIPVLTAVTAVFLWLAAKPFGSGASFGQAMAVTALAGVPRGLLNLLAAGAMAALGREAGSVFGATASPAFALGPDASPVLAAALSRLDVGLLWQTALMGLGIALMGRLVRRAGAAEVQGRIPVARGMAAAFALWALAGAYFLWQAYSSTLT